MKNHWARCIVVNFFLPSQFMVMICSFIQREDVKFKTSYLNISFTTFSMGRGKYS